MAAKKKTAKKATKKQAKKVAKKAAAKKPRAAAAKVRYPRFAKWTKAEIKKRGGQGNAVSSLGVQDLTLRGWAAGTSKPRADRWAMLVAAWGNPPAAVHKELGVTVRLAAVATQDTATAAA